MRLASWGAGAILIDQYSTPTIVRIFSYIGGGLLGFGVLALLAFGRLFAQQDPSGTSQLLVASTIHLLATGGNLLVAYLPIVAVRTYTSLPEAAGFLLLGFQATVAYDLLLLGETFVVRLVPTAEEETAE
ncbi:hypothetical protein BRC86_02750 [Halobacteriales archaeon QS_3_64_16]|nr:MAG: hypothetical protein BRC86_02750 [Halobacteriales archaeon QS_3_64_16]